MKTSGPLFLVAGVLLALATPSHAQLGKILGKKKSPDKTETKKAAKTADKPAPAVVTPATDDDAAAFTIESSGNKEVVVIKLRPDLAPKAVANFQQNIRDGVYNGLAFHRVIPGYLVQTGDPQSKDDATRNEWGTKDAGAPLPPEFAGKHKRGAVAMARKNDEVNPKRESSGSQFYMMLRDAAQLDGNYTVFGEVVNGLDVLQRISGAAADTNDAPLKRITVTSAKLIRSDSRLATAVSSGAKGTQSEASKGPVTRFIERVW